MSVLAFQRLRKKWISMSPGYFAHPSECTSNVTFEAIVLDPFRWCSSRWATGDERQLQAIEYPREEDHVLRE